MTRLKKLLIKLLNSAEIFGINDNDLKNAKEFFNYHEYDLCFDIIITQMYEYDIEIDKEFYKLIVLIGNILNLPQENYSFMEELIRDS